MKRDRELKGMREKGKGKHSKKREGKVYIQRDRELRGMREKGKGKCSKKRRGEW